MAASVKQFCNAFLRSQNRVVVRYAAVQIGQYQPLEIDPEAKDAYFEAPELTDSVGFQVLAEARA